jgi:hypothetical protein
MPDEEMLDETEPLETKAPEGVAFELEEDEDDEPTRPMRYGGQADE